MVKFCSLQQLSPCGDTGAELEHKSCSSLAGMDPPLEQLPSLQHLTGMFTQSSSENQLRFVCTFSPRRDSLRRSGHEEYNGDTHYESMSVVVPAQCSVYQLRLRICMQVGAPPTQTSPSKSHPICTDLQFYVPQLLFQQRFTSISQCFTHVAYWHFGLRTIARKSKRNTCIVSAPYLPALSTSKIKGARTKMSRVD